MFRSIQDAGGHLARIERRQAKVSKAKLRKFVRIATLSSNSLDRQKKVQSSKTRKPYSISRLKLEKSQIAKADVC